MKLINSKIMKSNSGFTLLEVLIASLITGILVSSTFQFFTKVSSQTEAQYQLADAQLICRNSVMELKKNIRMAGYKVGAHTPYYFAGDTVIVYMEGTNPVDTIKYFLTEYTAAEYLKIPNLPKDQKVFNLVKQVNSDSAFVYSDYITGLRVTAPTATEALIQIRALTAKPDYDKTTDNGFRFFTLSERVKMRNVN